VLELKLHVELDRVTAKSDVVRRIGVVSKGQLEAKLLDVELNGPLDVPRGTVPCLPATAESKSA
jgi:hypothetical protein